jgi:hypothetical protein
MFNRAPGFHGVGQVAVSLMLNGVGATYSAELGPLRMTQGEGVGNV